MLSNRLPCFFSQIGSDHHRDTLVSHCLNPSSTKISPGAGSFYVPAPTTFTSAPANNSSLRQKAAPSSSVCVHYEWKVHGLCVCCDFILLLLAVFRREDLPAAPRSSSRWEEDDDQFRRCLLYLLLFYFSIYSSSFHPDVRKSQGSITLPLSFSYRSSLLCVQN